MIPETLTLTFSITALISVVAFIVVVTARITRLIMKIDRAHERLDEHGHWIDSHDGKTEKINKNIVAMGTKIDFLIEAVSEIKKDIKK